MGSSKLVRNSREFAITVFVVTLIFYTPVFRRDVLWYGDVRPGLRPSVRLSVRSPSVRPSGSPSARFPHFSPTCFDILSWNFAHDFLLMYYRSSLSVITLRQFLKELCLFVKLEYRKYTVFRSFLLPVLTYWAEILHMTWFSCTTDQVHFASIFEGVMPLCDLTI